MPRPDQAITCIALLATAGCGYVGTAPLAVFFAAVMISSLRSEVHLALAEKYAPIGRGRAWALFASVSIAGHAIWCAIAFALGRAVGAITQP